MNKDGWVSVKERMPEYNNPVLTMHEDYPNSINAMMLFDSGEGWLWAAPNFTWNLLDPDCYVCDDEYTCTHWMPFPEVKEVR